MNSKQSSTKTMCRRVSNLLKKYPLIFTPLPKFTTLQTEFDANLTQMDTLGNQQGQDVSGLRTKKEEMKASTAQKALDMCHRLEAFAKITGDVVLAKKVHFSDTYLSKLPDNTFMTTCNIIFDLADANKTEAAEYGVTTEVLADLKTAMDDYKAVVDAPKEGSSEKKMATDQLANLFAGQAIVLDKIDALVEMVRYTNPTLYAEYWHTRHIEYRSGSLSVKCEVTDAATSLPLGGAVISFYINEELILEKTTSTTGGITAKGFDDGTYTVNVTRIGYAPQSLIVNVLDVEMTAFKVAMVAVPIEQLKSQLA
jgi:hypothetical protein